MDPLDVMKMTVEAANGSGFEVLPRVRPPLIGDGQTVHIIDAISRELEEPDLPAKRWSILKVPTHIREVDETAYNPRMVSIGPFHYKKTRFRIHGSSKTAVSSSLAGPPKSTT
uniref:Uncharacterized protein n=1 Tax=Davidia involucrata TaxID=16924 RepID=A0A5B7BTK4_DAVIN